MDRYPGPKATSSTRAPAGRLPVSRPAAVRYVSIWLAVPRIRAYHRATSPSISGPLTRHRATAFACISAPYLNDPNGVRGWGGHLIPNSVRIASVNEKEGLSRARLVAEA